MESGSRCPQRRSDVLIRLSPCRNAIEISHSLSYCILSTLWYRFDIDFTSIEIKRRRIVKRLAIGTLTIVVLGSTLLAHPHFRKTITAKLGTVDVTVAYQTVPSNEMHAQNAKVGAFTTPRAPTADLVGGTQGRSDYAPGW